MRNRSGRIFRRVILVLFLCIVVGCGFAVLYLGSSTGLTFGGSSTQLARQSGSFPLYGQVGWLRNTAPWPLTIDSVTTNAVNATAQPTVYIEDEQVEPFKQSGKIPAWATTASHAPFQLDGGSLRYLGFALTPQKDQVAAMTRITVSYTGPLGIHFHKTFIGTRVAASSSTLPAGVLGVSPFGNPGSLDAYIVALRSALDQPTVASIARVMGNGATPAQAQAFITSQKAYADGDSVSTVVVTKDGRNQRIAFYKGDPTKGSLPPIEVIWSGYRWTIMPAGS